MITGINHVQVTIPVGAEEQARQFYCKTLGLKEIDKPDALKRNGGLWLQVGALQVHIGCEQNDYRAQSKAHIAYEIKNLAHWRQTFLDIGIKISESTPIDGFDRFDIRDPFGNRIELIESTS